MFIRLNSGGTWTDYNLEHLELPSAQDTKVAVFQATPQIF